MTITRSKLCMDCGATVEVDCYDFPYGSNETVKQAVWSLFETIVCDDCAGKREAKDADHKRLRIARAAHTQSYGRGWMPQDALQSTFANSASVIEIRSDNVATGFLWGRKWLPEQEKPWGFLMGPKGTGKSFLARCILNRAISLGLTAREIDADTLQKAGQAWVDGDKFIKGLEDADILLVEEIGIPQWVEAGVVALRKIVDHRWRAGMYLLVTSNLSPEELRPIWQKACARNVSIYDSMNDRMRNFARITLDGESLRGGAK